MGVFGSPITVNTLRGNIAYVGHNITQSDCAWQAQQVSQNDVAAAQTHVDNLKNSWGAGVCTECLFYNQTGADLTFVTSNDYHGHIGAEPYPSTISNGQWGSFLHVKTSGVASGSEAAVVYRGTDPNSGATVDFFIGWCNPWSRGSNTVYCEVREKDHWPNGGGSWDYMQGLIEGGSLSHSDSFNNGCNLTVSTGNDTTATLKAYFGLVNPTAPPAPPSS